MARAELPITVINATTGVPVAGASVAVKYRSSGANATWWTQETGGTSSTAAITTDSAGRATGWFDRGAYNCTISGTGITTYTEPWDAIPAADNAADALWLPDNIIVARHLSAAAISAVVPTGTILSYAFATAPTGFQNCDGAVGASSALLALLDSAGRPYGGSAGAGFVPNLKGRSPLGTGLSTATGATTHTLGQSSGEETHVLSSGEMPAHVHEIRSSTVFDGIPVESGGTQISSQHVRGSGTNPGENTATTGGGSAHNNMHPYVAVNFIIKT